jgi:hypothetical protein
MTAKMKSKPYRNESRPDWDEVRVEIMRWCLRVKLAQHWEKFSALLLSTGHMPIVEESYRDPFWGARPTTPETLVGTNMLGQLLTELRDQLQGQDVDKLRIVLPPTLPNFLLIDKPIGVIQSTDPRPRAALNSAPSQLTSGASYDDSVKAPACNASSQTLDTEMALADHSALYSNRQKPAQLTLDFFGG